MYHRFKERVLYKEKNQTRRKINKTTSIVKNSNKTKGICTENFQIVSR